MTKYRTICDGYITYLQYEKVIKHKFLFWKWEKSEWYYIPKPCYNKISGQMFKSFWDRYLTEYDYSLKAFATIYPNIENYLAEYDKRQNALIQESIDHKNAVKAKEGKITYL